MPTHSCRLPRKSALRPGAGTPDHPHHSPLSFSCSLFRSNSILESPSQELTLAAPVSVAIEDAYLSAWKEMSPRISDRELTHFVGPHLMSHGAQPKPRDVLAMLDPVEGMQWLALVGMAWSDVLAIGRDLAKKVSSCAWRSDLLCVCVFFRWTESCFNWCAHRSAS